MPAMSAKQILQDFLETNYGLGDLGQWAWDLFTNSGASDINEFVRGQLAVELPKTASFKARFPAYEELMKQGRGMTVDQYRQYEKDVNDLAHTYGAPPGMFDDRDYLATIMKAGVSPRELEQRFVINRDQMYALPPEVKQAFASMYGAGNTEGALTAYLFDPSKALPLLQQQSQAAQIAGAAIQQSVDVGQATAERLARQGITWEQAQQGFRQVAGQRALTYGAGDVIDQGTETNAAFGDAKSQAEVQRVQRARSAQFQGGGGVAESQSGVSGLGSASR